MLGIRQGQVPRWHRVAWAVALLIVTVVLLRLGWTRGSSGPAGWGTTLLGATVCAALGYFGCGWERDR